MAVLDSRPRLFSTTSGTGHAIGEFTLVFFIAGLLMGVDCTELVMPSSFAGVDGFVRVLPPSRSAFGLDCSTTGPARGAPDFFWGVATIALPLISAPKNAEGLKIN